VFGPLAFKALENNATCVGWHSNLAKYDRYGKTSTHRPAMRALIFLVWASEAGRTWLSQHRLASDFGASYKERIILMN